METPNEPAKPADERVKRKMMYLHRFAAGKITKDATNLWMFVPDEWEPGDGAPEGAMDAVVSQAEGGDDYDRAIKFFTIGDAITKNPQPGQVYEFEFTPNLKSVYFKVKGKADYVGWCNDVKLTTYCHTMNRLADAQSKAGKEGTQAAALEVLEPLRSVYYRLPNAGRAQFIAMVVHYIVSGKPKPARNEDD